ncbi:MAG TPA: hypothetical protein VFF73_40245 [Planctomycetota bacterium]|nr:hypothetical protein [Planctomycetota bacterium]
MARVYPLAVALSLVASVSFADDELGALGEDAPRTFTRLDVLLKKQDSTLGTGTAHAVIAADGKVAIEYENLPLAISNAKAAFKLTPDEVAALQSAYAASRDERVARDPVPGAPEFELRVDGRSTTKGALAEYPGLADLLQKALTVPEGRVDQTKDLTKGVIALHLAKKDANEDLTIDMKVEPDGCVTGSFKGVAGAPDGDFKVQLAPEQLASVRADLANVDWAQKPSKSAPDDMHFTLSAGNDVQGRSISGGLLDYPDSLQKVTGDLVHVLICAAPSVQGATDHPSCPGITKVLGAKAPE